MTTDAGQAYMMLKQWLLAREVAPWVAGWMETYGADVDRLVGCPVGKTHTGMRPGYCIRRLGGMAGVW